MATSPHEGLRQKLSAIVVIVIGLVMLPFVLIAASFLQNQGREQSEHELVAITHLVGALLASQHETLARTAARLADGLQAHWSGRFALRPRRGDEAGPGLLLDGRPVASLGAELARFAGDKRGTLVALLARDGARFVTCADSSLRSAAASPFQSLDGSMVPLDVLMSAGRWSGVLRHDGVPWLAELRPLFDASGQVVGLLLVASDLGADLRGLKDRLRDFAIGASGYIFVIDAHPGPQFGSFVLHPTREGENPLAAAGGEMRATMEQLLHDGDQVVAYRWQNPRRGETEARDKIAALTVYRPLDWVIGASSYADEFGRTATVSRRYMIGAAVLMAVLLVAALNLAIGRLVITPMLRLQRTLRTLSRGNEVVVHSQDERALLDGICGVLVEVGGFRFARIGLADAAGPPLAGAAAAGSAAAFEAALRAGKEGGADPAEAALHGGRVIHWCNLAAESPPLKRAGAAAGCAALVAFPLQEGARQLGVLSIGAAHAREFDRAGTALLQELADDLSFGIASLRTAAAHRAAEAALRLHERALEASRDGILIIEPDAGHHRLRYANPALERITGLRREALVGARLSALTTFDTVSLAALATAIDSRRETVVEITGRLADGSPLWCECSLAPVTEGERVTHVVGVIKDVTERVSYLRQLEHQAKYDALTGLPNRSLLDDRLQQGLIAARRRGRMLAVAFLDIDHFKLINDKLGHRSGDHLLQWVAERLGTALGDGDTAARLGGDEFVLVLPDLRDEQSAYLALRRVQQAMMRPVSLDGESFLVTVSLGVSLYPKDGDDAETLLRNADMAMYQAKEGGRDTIRFFTAEMNVRVQERVALEQALRRVLERDELRLNYQPVVMAEGGEVIGAEALLRWRHPSLGNVAPLRFVPLAEELGIIGPIGEWVMAGACRQAMAWAAAGRPLRVSVNVSARQFRDADFPERVAAILAQSGLAPGLLELELTESVLMGEAEHTVRMLRRLKDIGVRIAADDFGTGYSSFAYLRRFPLDTLKIDQSFVADVEAGGNAEAIVAAIIAMAHSMGLGVIAEGVATAGQHEVLRRHGCDELQGERFGVPMDAAAFAAELAARGAGATPR